VGRRDSIPQSNRTGAQARVGHCRYRRGRHTAWIVRLIVVLYCMYLSKYLFASQSQSSSRREMLTATHHIATIYFIRSPRSNISSSESDSTLSGSLVLFNLLSTLSIAAPPTGRSASMACSVAFLLSRSDLRRSLNSALRFLVGRASSLYSWI
jgi:hypothetical protein